MRKIRVTFKLPDDSLAIRHFRDGAAMVDRLAYLESLRCELGDYGCNYAALACELSAIRAELERRMIFQPSGYHGSV
jgi:hypothetical protein